MAKVTIQTIANLDNPPTAVSQLNANFVALQTVIDTLLSRDGAAPNSMLSLLDMNNNRIVNLPVPVSPTEPARHGDIQQYVDQAEAAADAAEISADRAEAEADASEASAIAAQLAEDGAEEAEVGAVEALANFLDLFRGVLPTAPTAPDPGEDIRDFEGVIYFDSTLNVWRVYVVDDVIVGVDDVLAGAAVVVIGDWVSFESDSGLNVQSQSVDNLVALTLTEYNAITPAARTLYFVTDDT